MSPCGTVRDSARGEKTNMKATAFLIASALAGSVTSTSYAQDESKVKAVLRPKDSDLRKTVRQK